MQSKKIDQPPGGPEEPRCVTNSVVLGEDEENNVTAAIAALEHMLHTSQGDEQLKEKTAAEYLRNFSSGLSEGDRRYIVYRFLKARGFDIPKALRSLINTAEYRRRQNLSHMALFPSLIPTRGYEEQALCEALKAPFIQNPAQQGPLVNEAGQLQLAPGDMDYYGSSYDATYDAYKEHFKKGVQTPQLDSIPVADRQESRLPPPVPTAGSHSNDGENMLSPNSSARRGSASSAHAYTSTWSRLKGAIFGNSPTAPRRQSFTSATQGEDSTQRPQWGAGESAMSSVSGESSDGEREHEEHSMAHRESDEGSEVSMVLNKEGAGLAITANPRTEFCDYLNFHGLLQPIVSTVCKYVPMSFHYWDRQGHPVLYCKLDRLYSKKLLEDLFQLSPTNAHPRALAALFHTYLLEIMTQLIRYNNMKNREGNKISQALLTPQLLRSRDKNILPMRGPVGGCVVILDCKGVRINRYFYKPLFKLLKDIMSVTQRQYPELLHHMYITNCHKIVHWSYLTLRNILPESTRKKLTFCSNRNTSPTLLNVISAELLPEELGGRCQCQGGCIPALSSAATDGASSADSSSSRGDTFSATGSLSVSYNPGGRFGFNEAIDRGLGTHWYPDTLHRTVHKLVVRPRRTFQVTFEMQEHEEIIWDFSVRKHRRITFAARFISAADDGGMLSLVDRRRVESDAGHFICPSIGTVILEWSNRRSLIHRCRIYAKIYQDGS